MTSFKERPQAYARLGGWLYLYIIVAGFYVEMFVRAKIIVYGDALKTAHNLVAFEPVWRFGIAAEFTMWLAATILSIIFYALLRPVSRNIALLATVFALLDTAIESLNAVLCNFAALFFAKGGSYLEAFSASQRAALASLALRLHEYGFGLGLLFFTFFLVLAGYLMVRSGYFPKWLGALAIIGGICYAINSYALFVAPGIEDALFPFILLPSLVAELSITLFLIVKGIDMRHWPGTSSV